MNPVILNNNNHIISAQSIFGKDANKVMSIVKSLFDRYMWPFENNAPKPSDYGFSMATRKEWMQSEQRNEYRSAKKEWEEKDDKLIKALYGIAKRHHVHVKWLRYSTAASFPDQFFIYKNGNRIAMIQL